MTTQIVSVLNQKGGVGKTTVAVNLAYSLAANGYRVLLVDLDTQGNVSDSLGMDPAPDLHSLLVASDPINSLIVSSGNDGPRRRLHVIRSNERTAEAKMYLASLPFRERVLARVLRPTRDWYNFIILDLAPSVDILHVGALVASDGIVVVTKLDKLAVKGVRQALLTLGSLEDMDAPQPKLLGIVPNMWDRRTVISAGWLTMLARNFKAHLWPPIPIDVNVMRAAMAGQAVAEYDSKTRALIGADIGNGHPVGGILAVYHSFMKAAGVGDG